jgi:hypothetical protein
VTMRSPEPFRSIANGCAFPGDLSLSEDVDVIRWRAGAIWINGYLSSVPRLTLEDLARAVLNVVLDPVPPALVTPFAEEVVSRLGLSWIMLSSDVEAWVRGR